jgi:hypothetical protein
MTRKAAQRFLATVFFLILGTCIPLTAAAPNRLSYQGILTDDNGNYLTGSYNFQFEIYSVPQSDRPTSRLWGPETQNAITVTNGIYNIEIGSFTAIPQSVFDNNDCYLQVNVNNEDLTPRQHLLPTPYAASLLPGASVPDLAVRASTGAIQAQLDAVQASTGTAAGIDPAVRVSTGIIFVQLGNVAISTTTLKSQLNAVQLSTFTVASLNLSQYATTTDTGTISTQIISLGISTAAIQAQLNAVQASTGTASVIDSEVRASTGAIQTQLNAVQLSTFTVASLNLSQYATTTDTGTISTQIISLGISTAAIQAQLNAVQASTGTASVIDSEVRASTGAIQTQLNAVQLSTFTVDSLNLAQFATAIDTGTLQSRVYGLEMSTGAIQAQLNAVQASTGTIIGSANTWAANQVFNTPVSVGTSGTTHGLLNITGSNDHLVIEKSDAGIDLKLWQIKASTSTTDGALEINIPNDEWNSWPNFLKLNRDGTTPKDMTVQAPVIAPAITVSTATITSQLKLPTGDPASEPAYEGLLMYYQTNHTAYISTGTAAGSWQPLW